MNLRDRMHRAVDSPRELESLYRANPAEFAQAFSTVFQENPDSIILRVWNERLVFDSALASGLEGDLNRTTLATLARVVLLSLAAGTAALLPDFIRSLDEQLFYLKNLSFIVFMSLSAYFLTQSIPSIRFIAKFLALFVGSLIFINIIPGDSHSQTLALSCLHMPVLLWAVLGVSFAGGRLNDFSRRMAYIRYNGELVIVTTVILIGGAILVMITTALFQMIDIHFEAIYLKYLIAYGLAASPVVGTFIIDRVMGNRSRISSILSYVFTPLFFLASLAYLVAMAFYKESPYSNRDFLLIFNILLLVVLALSILSIAGRGSDERRSAGDLMNSALVVVTLAVDAVALSAILLRIASFGFSPNRIALLGANVLVFCHLCGIAFGYARFFRRTSSAASVAQWVVGYIPVYVAWAMVVTFGFPFVFRFA